MQYITKDSGVRKERKSGFHRDTDEGKPRYDLIPFDCLKRLAELYARGAVKYGDNNRRLAEEQDAIDRFRQSAFRHFMQRINGENDEDHGFGCVFNIFAYEHLTNRYKTTDIGEVEQPSEQPSREKLIYELYDTDGNKIFECDELNEAHYKLISLGWCAKTQEYNIEYFGNRLSDGTPIYTNWYKDGTTVNFVPMCLIKEEWKKDLSGSTGIIEGLFDYDVQRVINNLCI